MGKKGKRYSPWFQFQVVLEVLKGDREAMAQDLRKISWAEDQGEAGKALSELQARWGEWYPKLVAAWEEKADALLRFLAYPKELRGYLYTTNQLERRVKVVEVFCGEQVVEKLLYLVLSDLNERLGTRRLRGFAQATGGDYYAS